MIYKMALLVLMLNSYPALNTKKIKNPFSNLHQVNANLYRSEQPDELGMAYLKELKIQTIINLREKQKDPRIAGEESFNFIHHPIVTWKFDEEDILSVMQIIKKSKGPILIHCKHGSDRTGGMVAAYRILFEGWTKDQALKELRQEQYGYHEFWFPDIAQFIEDMDIEKLKGKLKL